jgi:hypothetical protein
MVPALEAMVAGILVGFINRVLARLGQECPEDIRREMHRDDSSTSTASSGTVEIPHFH